MAMIARVALITLSLIAVRCIIVLQIRNGFFDLLTAAGSSKPLKLPGTSANAITKITGFAAFDSHLLGLLMFFWPTVSAESPSLSLFAFHMTGQVLAVHVLVLLEGLRAGNWKKMVYYSTVWGVLYQTVPWGMVMPVYFAVNLWPSKTVQPSSPRDLANNLAIDSRQLKMLPVSVLLGFIIPTFLAGIPPPLLTTVTQQQFLIIFWQAFPVWIAICQYILTTISAALMRKTKTENPTSMIIGLRVVYILSLSLVGYIHATTIVFAAIPSLRPSFFSPTARPEVTLASVFLPISPFSAAKVETLQQGCLILLQYDLYFASGAALLWALVVRNRVGDAIINRRAVVSTLLFGPGGAALALLWERDEMVFCANDGLFEKRRKAT